MPPSPGRPVDLRSHFTVDVAVEAGQHVDRPAREGETDDAGRGVGFRGGGHGAEGPAVEGDVFEGGVQQPVAGGFQRVFRGGFVWHVAALGSLPGCLPSADRVGAHGVLGKAAGEVSGGCRAKSQPVSEVARVRDIGRVHAVARNQALPAVRWFNAPCRTASAGLLEICGGSAKQCGWDMMLSGHTVPNAAR